MVNSRSTLHNLIQEYYTERLQQKESCCSSSSCCSSEDVSSLKPLEGIPIEAQPISFGCGDPLTLAELQEGQVVLDLGSGTGYDCFLAAKRVGKTGRVIGVDMTPQMILQATQNAQRLNLSNVEFRLGYLEDLPVESNSVDVILSNCVINLAPDKAQVFKEAYRVLNPNGLLAITDMISLSELPLSLKQDAKAWAACIAGAVTKDELTHIMAEAGFRQIEIYLSNPLLSPTEKDLASSSEEDMTSRLAKWVVSARIRAVKES